MIKEFPKDLLKQGENIFEILVWRTVEDISKEIS